MARIEFAAAVACVVGALYWLAAWLIRLPDYIIVGGALVTAAYQFQYSYRHWEDR